MGNIWGIYTQKDTPVDNDELMIYDSEGKSNKRLLFSGFWKWIAKKLKEAELSDLQTADKTIIGAINTLNSEKKIKWNVINLNDVHTDDAGFLDTGLSATDVYAIGICIVSKGVYSFTTALRPGDMHMYIRLYNNDAAGSICRNEHFDLISIGYFY